MTQSFRVGEWHVRPDDGTVTRGEDSVRLEPKVMEVLVYLAEHAGEVLPKEQIIRAVWTDLFVTDEVLTNAISALRKAFGDDPRNPRYIETLPRRGYRLVAEVEQAEERCAAGYVEASLKRRQEDSRLQETSTPPPKRQAPWLLATAAGVAVLAIGAWYWLGASDAPRAPLKPVPLTSYPGYEYTASFSPDGESVVFDWCRSWDSDCDIFIKQVGVEPSHPLTETPEDELAPAWSPDGRWIAFLRLLTPGRWGLILMPSRGGFEMNLGEIGSFGESPWEDSSPPAWTPDSKFIAAPVSEPASRSCSLWLVSVETGDRRRLTEAPREDSWSKDLNPAFSADGRTLAFSRRNQEGYRIHLLDLSAGFEPLGPPRILPTGIGNTHGPIWMPGSDELLLKMGGLGRKARDVWRMRLRASGEPSRFLDGAYSPAVSPRGDRLVYSEEVRDTNIWQISLGDPDGRGGSPSKLNSTRMDYLPAWSPNGRQIAFTSSRSGESRIWISEADGTRARPISAAVGQAPAWSPTGDSIVFETGGGRRGLSVIGADGLSPRSLPTGWNEQGALWPYWSRDGRWIYFRSLRGGTSRIWKVPAEGGDAVPVTENEGDLPQESSDGKLLYYMKGEEYPTRCSVWRVPVSGGQETQVLGSVFCHGGWSVSESGIYYLSPSEGDDRGEIHFYDLTSRDTRVITSISQPYTRLAISPDGSTLLYVQSDHAGSDLMLVENFR